MSEARSSRTSLAVQIATLLGILVVLWVQAMGPMGTPEPPQTFTLELAEPLGEVTTPRRPGESLDSWLARGIEVVEEAIRLAEE
jgi:hypothetical protein